LMLPLAWPCQLELCVLVGHLAGLLGVMLELQASSCQCSEQQASSSPLTTSAALLPCCRFEAIARDHLPHRAPAALSKLWQEVRWRCHCCCLSEPAMCMILHRCYLRTAPCAYTHAPCAPAALPMHHYSTTSSQHTPASFKCMPDVTDTACLLLPYCSTQRQAKQTESWQTQRCHASPQRTCHWPASPSPSGCPRRTPHRTSSSRSSGCSS
jgi:hypothetical protein